MVDDEGERDEAEYFRERKPELKRDTNHAPDLLEGPSINHSRE